MKLFFALLISICCAQLVHARELFPCEREYVQRYKELSDELERAYAERRASPALEGQLDAALARATDKEYFANVAAAGILLRMRQLEREIANDRTCKFD